MIIYDCKHLRIHLGYESLRQLSVTMDVLYNVGTFCHIVTDPCAAITDPQGSADPSLRNPSLLENSNIKKTHRSQENTINMSKIFLLHRGNVMGTIESNLKAQPFYFYTF